MLAGLSAMLCGRVRPCTKLEVGMEAQHAHAVQYFLASLDGRENILPFAFHSDSIGMQFVGQA